MVFKTMLNASLKRSSAYFSHKIFIQRLKFLLLITKADQNIFLSTWGKLKRVN